MRILMVSSSLEGLTMILFNELARAEFLAEISRNFCWSIIMMMRI